MEKREIKDLEIKEEHPVEEQKKVPEDMVPVEQPLEERIEELEAELSGSRERYLRLYAEFENYKKRVQKDKEEMLKYGTEPLLQDLLTVLDNLEMAIQHAEKDTSAESLIQGVELTLKEFRKVLNKYGISEIEAVGKPFDPAYHHAMSEVERSDLDDKTVVEEYRKGYMLKDRTIRPAMVAVSRKTPPEDT
ncbi:Heat shock protein GrpE [hydrothermal vent metagenome]|uniref:Heat shock protein GrpE n=1 Tax=hydrothermal vent metagenome TaxID=652676 RepID=A0A3B1CKK1_9ZZZZ